MIILGQSQKYKFKAALMLKFEIKKVLSSLKANIKMIGNMI